MPDPAPPTLSTSVEAAPAKPRGGRPLVLLAEDDHEMRRSLAWALRRAGYDVNEFKSGARLADYIVDSILRDPERSIADIVVSDVRMPGASGLEILEGMRTFDAALPVILITAFGSAATHAEAAELGASVLDKPFDIDELIAAVRKALRPMS